MSKQTTGRTAQTGAIFGRGIFAVRRHTYKPNTIRRLRRQCVITSINEVALAEIDAMAKKHGVSRGEAIGLIVRELRREIVHLQWRQANLENEFAQVKAR